MYNAIEKNTFLKAPKQTNIKMKLALALLFGLMVATIKAHRGFGGGWGHGGGWGRGLGWGMGMGMWNRCGLYPYSPYCGYPYAWGVGRRAIAESRPRIECNYSKERSMLGCAASSNFVECETVGLFEKYKGAFFNFYAISATPVGSLSFPETIKFPVYPEMSEERGWLNSSFVEPTTQKPCVYSLYSGAETSERGFRVTNATCYARLVSLFTGSNFNETIVIGRASEKLGQVDVIGGILLA